MEQHEGQNIVIDPKKCYSCGKIFKFATDLARHKNRKTPCLIREISDERKLDPNRCIFCNKIFSKKSNLTKHLETCKIKNGGMNILDEKVRYEEEIRILKEQREKDKADYRKEIMEMREQMEQLKGEMKQLKEYPERQVVQIGTVNNITQNFNFHNYDKPFTDTLKFTQDDLLVTNIAKKLIEMIYFNKDLPQNHTLYYPNIKERRLLVYKNGEWQNISDEKFPEVMTTVKNNVQLIGHDKINGGNVYTEQTFERLYPVVKEAIVSFNTHGNHAHITDNEILDIVKTNKEMIKRTLTREHIL